jgi:hypothetical protein
MKYRTAVQVAFLTLVDSALVGKMYAVRLEVSLLWPSGNYVYHLI